VYGEFDCITLVKQFYSQFGIVIDLPIYQNNRRWNIDFSVEKVYSIIDRYSKKVNLTEITDYDLITFTSKNKVIHFGIYLSVFKMLHIEENKVSSIDNLNEYWVSKIGLISRLHNVV
jgi:cell wall-associated NlpC family hydrolase